MFALSLLMLNLDGINIQITLTPYRKKVNCKHRLTYIHVDVHVRIPTYIVLNFPACGKSFDPHVEQRDKKKTKKGKKNEAARQQQKQQTRQKSILHFRYWISSSRRCVLFLSFIYINLQEEIVHFCCTSTNNKSQQSTSRGKNNNAINKLQIILHILWSIPLTQRKM